MKKVLFVANTLQVGGAEKILVNILKNIDKKKYDITVLALVNYGVFVDEIKKIDGIKYIAGFRGIFNKTKLNSNSIFYGIENKIMQIKLKKYSKKIKNATQRLYKKFINEQYDVEIAFLEGRVSKFVSKSLNNKSKKIAWIHTDIDNKQNTDENFIDEIDEIESYKKMNKIICVSEMVKEKFVKKTNIQDNVYVQINPIDSSNILELSNEKIDFENRNAELILCTVGRLEEVKGYKRLLEVHKKLLDQSIRHKLWFVGDGSQLEWMKSYIKDNNLEQTVTLWGFQKNPFKFIKNANIYVCSSFLEGLSSTAIEATILEKIVVTTDCPGMKEIFGEDNECALIVDNNTEALFNGIKEILTNKDLRNKYEKNIKKRCKLFNLEKTMKEIEKIIEE